MRLLVAAIGRLKDGPERELAERYEEINLLYTISENGPFGVAWHPVTN
jgi:hypothetical protein